MIPTTSPPVVCHFAGDTIICEGPGHVSTLTIVVAVLGVLSLFACWGATFWYLLERGRGADR